MPEPSHERAISAAHHVAFALPCSVARGVAYVRDPSVLFGALPSVVRVIARTRGTYRLVLAPVRALNLALRPAAEVTITATDDHVAIESVPWEPHALQNGEIATHINATLHLHVTQTGCAIDATLRLALSIPAHAFPPVARAITHQAAVGFLDARLRHELQEAKHALVAGYREWGATSNEQ